MFQSPISVEDRYPEDRYLVNKAAYFRIVTHILHEQNIVIYSRTTTISSHLSCFSGIHPVSVKIAQWFIDTHYILVSTSDCLHGCVVQAAGVARLDEDVVTRTTVPWVRARLERRSSARHEGPVEVVRRRLRHPAPAPFACGATKRAFPSKVVRDASCCWLFRGCCWLFRGCCWLFCGC